MAQAVAAERVSAMKLELTEARARIAALEAELLAARADLVQLATWAAAGTPSPANDDG